MNASVYLLFDKQAAQIQVSSLCSYEQSKELDNSVGAPVMTP